jgi:hypothetical protein
MCSAGIRFRSALSKAGHLGSLREDFGPGEAILCRGNHALFRPVRPAVPRQGSAPRVCLQDALPALRSCPVALRRG